MSRFAINKDFDHAKRQVEDSDVIIEIIKLDSEYYGIIEVVDGNPLEIGVYNYGQLKAIWQLLTVNK